MSPTARPALLLALPAIAALLLGPSCNGDAFEGDEGGGAGGAGGETGNEAGNGAAVGGAGAGADASGGAVNLEAGSGGARESGGEASAGGAGGSGSCTESADCPDGEFCRDGACVSCTDFSDLDSLEYGPGEPFELINGSSTEEGLRFARRLPDGLGLIYVRDFFGGTIWFTSDPASSVGAPISKTDVYESGGLPLTHELPAPLSGFNFFFGRRVRSGTDAAKTRLFGAVLGEDGTLSGEEPLPAPFNSDSVIASYGLALSTKRAVWTHNVNGAVDVHLLTSPLPPKGEPTELRLPLPEGCGLAGELDYGPWLTPDGRTLFFSAHRVDEGCTPIADASTHIYVVALSSAGQPIGTARALTGHAAADVRQTDPSLSPDGCELLFSAQPDNSMQLYRAPRIR